MLMVPLCLRYLPIIVVAINQTIKTKLGFSGLSEQLHKGLHGKSRGTRAKRDYSDATLHIAFNLAGKYSTALVWGRVQCHLKKS